MILFQNYRSYRAADERTREIHSTARAVSLKADPVRLSCLDHNLNAILTALTQVSPPQGRH